MQFSMSKVALAVTGLSLLSSAAFAGTMGDLNTDTKRWFAFAAPIYGRITDGNIDRNPLTVITAPGVSRTEYVPSLNSDWGLNVGLGYRFGANATDQLSFGYTYLQNTGRKTVESGIGSDNSTDVSRIIGTMNGGFSATARTKISYNDFQLTLSRLLDGDWNKNLELSRSYAIKATMIERSVNFLYTGGANSFAGVAIPGTATDAGNYKFNFFGIGPKAGLGARYKFTEGFSIGGDLSLAILAGYAKSRYNEALNLTQAGQIFFSTPASSVYTYSKQNPSSSLLALVLGGNFSLKQSFAMQNTSKLDVELGYGGDAYISSASDRMGAGFSNNFAMENIFLKFSYFS